VLETGKLFLIALGIVFVIEGTPYAFFPNGMKRFLAQIPAIPNGFLRLFGVTAILLGFGLVFWGRS
jgi:uncharacterized protein